MSTKKLSRSETNLFSENKSNIVDIRHQWILFRWNKSLWKKVWKELLAYTLVFLLISLVLHYMSDNEIKIYVEKFIKYVRNTKGSTHLTFILGLYIGVVVKRWWDQYATLPWPDELALHLQASVIDQSDSEEKGRLVRRSIIRYCLASYILAIRTQSFVLRERFPHIDKLVETGLLQKHELNQICEFGNNIEKYTSRWWVPLQWSMQLLANAKRDGLVSPGPEYSSLVSRVTDFKHKLEMVKAYGSNPLPLMYSQVVHLAVYVYLALTLVGDQSVSGDEPYCFLLNTLPLVFKFLFYYGLQSVATSMYNPWGDDDEDFRLNDLLSRHLKVAMEIVDGTQNAPELRKDHFWGQANPEMRDNVEHEEGGEINSYINKLQCI